MNRIQHSANPAKESPAGPTFTIESGLFTQPRHEYPRVFFGPKHYEPNYAYPLIVWLHGPGGDERQLVRIMPAVSLRNYVAVAPRGLPGGAGAADPEGFGWPQTAPSIQEAECRVSESIQAASQKFHVARRRVFLAGFDAGGTMALRVALADPCRFAGVLSLCGPFPQGHRPLRRLAQARRLPLLLAVGCDSVHYPAAQVCEDWRLLRTAGFSIILRQYSCGQELVDEMLRDVDRWIIQRITHPANRPPGGSGSGR
jgi:phospholipase/carboxylesterase